jgi:hypothetical protein
MNLEYLVSSKYLSLTARRSSCINLLSFDNCACPAALNSAPRPPEILITVRFVSKLSAGQWADARRLRAEGASFRAIAQAFDVSRDCVARRARRECWHTPGGMDAEPTAQAARALPDDALQARRALRQRIFRILDLDLKIMELRMQKRLSDAETGEASEGMSKEEFDRLATFKKTIQEHTEFSPDTEPSPATTPTPTTRKPTAPSGARPSFPSSPAPPRRCPPGSPPPTPASVPPRPQAIGSR